MKKEQIGFDTPDQAESVFYEAFMHCDSAVMSALWSKQQSDCVHPGSGLIQGYEAVVRSWQHILDQSGELNLEYRLLEKVDNDDTVIHMVEEMLITGDDQVTSVIATNIYQKTLAGWQIVLHHGSLVRSQLSQRQVN